MRALEQVTYDAFAELLAQPDPPDLPRRSRIPLQIGEAQPKWEISVVDVRRRQDEDARAAIDGGTDRKDV